MLEILKQYFSNLGNNDWIPFQNTNEYVSLEIIYKCVVKFKTFTNKTLMKNPFKCIEGGVIVKCKFLARCIVFFYIQICQCKIFILLSKRLKMCDTVFGLTSGFYVCFLDVCSFGMLIRISEKLYYNHYNQVDSIFYVFKRK